MIEISFVSNWIQGIIVSVVIATIIEMILPNGNNGKYVKMVIGVFVLFTIISPITKKITGSDNIDINPYISVASGSSTVLTDNSVNNNELIRQMYEENLKVDIKSRMDQMGYNISNLNVEILNNDEYTLNSISMKVDGKSQNQNNNHVTTTIVENVEGVLINISGDTRNNRSDSKSNIPESEKRKIIQFLVGIYGLKDSNVYIY